MNPPEERLNRKYVKKTFKSAQVKVMVWACFTGDRLGPMIVCDERGSEALIHSMPKHCQAVIDAKGGWTRINGICRYRTSQLNKIFTIVLVALLFTEHSLFELIDFDGGPFHVADTVYVVNR